jgi:peroxiredoxin
LKPNRFSIAFLMAVLLATTSCRERVRVTLLDLDGRPIALLNGTDAQAVVFLFVRSDCPISNRYAPELRRLATKFAPRGVTFYLVYPDPLESPDKIRAHVRDYDYPGTPLRDPDHRLVRITQAKVTPEAAVYTPDHRLVYRGRIDDWYVDFGKPRAAPTTHDLEDALEAVLGGRPVADARTTAVGCFIGDLK